MTGVKTGTPAALSRRATLLAPLALAGCDTIDGWFNPKEGPTARQARTYRRIAARLQPR
jgi:hypothetical protein